MAAADIPVHTGQAARLSSPWGFPIREDVAFTDVRGDESRGLSRRARRALERLQETLRKILEPDEAVLYFARGELMPGKPERYLLGVQSHHVGRNALILTNRRLLNLSFRWNGTWGHSLRSARLVDLKTFRVSGLVYGRLHIEFRDGSRETYWRMRKDAARKVGLLLSVLLPASEGETSAARGMASFCPNCLSTLIPQAYQCPGCQLKFKDEKTAVRRTLLIPGGGYFYVGLYLWAVFHALIDVSLLISAVLWGLAAAGWVNPGPLRGAPPGRSSFALMAIVPAAMLITDIWLGVRFSRAAIRRFIPVS